MRPVIKSPFAVRGLQFGGPEPVFCLPLVAGTKGALLDQALAVQQFQPDIVEWRADAFEDPSLDTLLDAARELRLVLKSEPIIFTLRSGEEGGNKAIGQEDRSRCIQAVLRSGRFDMIDLELCNGDSFLAPLMETARSNDVRIILSFHDFVKTPETGILLARIEAMAAQKPDVAKLACMPESPVDVARLLQATALAREQFPDLALCMTSMGGLGAISRVAGFLFGSDMSFAVGQETSAPGQLPIQQARTLSLELLQNSCS